MVRLLDKRKRRSRFAEMTVHLAPVAICTNEVIVTIPHVSANEG
jgi:hypothetical protein